MKLIGLMVCRNEDWVLEASLKAALQWCDEVVLVDHASTDSTYDIYHAIVGLNEGRIHYSRWHDDSKWDEMELRQHSLDILRKHKGTHAAIIDADEILTGNLVDAIRGEFERLEPGQCLEVPMLAMRTLDHYQDDSSVWSGAWITLGFKDSKDLSWKPDLDGYHHHHRAPYGISGTKRFLSKKSDGGVMHLQFANERRLLAKHVLYRMVDHLRWLGRETVEQLNFKYDQALQKPQKLSPASLSWWRPYSKSSIRLNGYPYQEGEVRRLLKEHGAVRFEGLDLKGLDQ